MARFLTILLIVTMVFAHGTSVAASICRHQDAHEHALARQSRDAKVAAISIAEEAAAADEAKKASQSAPNLIHWPTDLLPAALPDFPLRIVEPLRLRPGDQAALASASIRPLLEPPAA